MDSTSLETENKHLVRNGPSFGQGDLVARKLPSVFVRKVSAKEAERKHLHCQRVLAHVMI